VRLWDQWMRQCVRDSSKGCWRIVKWWHELQRRWDF
jgi:hypothetical protein